MRTAPTPLGGPGRSLTVVPVTTPTIDLAAQIAAVHAGQGDPDRLIARFRDALLLVPLGPRTTILVSDQGGIRWLPAFTSESELARYSVVRDEGDQECRYITVRGARILDEFLAAIGGACGVAIDIAGDRPMMLPPVLGIVPDAIAMDRDAED
jgi:hypothetical protein